MKAAVVVVIMLAAPAAAVEVRVMAPPVVAGEAPAYAVTGLPSRGLARIHVVRMFAGWERAPTGGWRKVPKPLTAWIDVRADSKGRVDLARAKPVAGSYRGPDPYGLLWSGRPPGDALAVAIPGHDTAKLPENESRLIVTIGRAIVAETALAFHEPRGLTIARVAEGAVNGTYAAPADGKRHPAIILLHGSEGGDMGGARDLAVRFAGQGYAAFALNYFAWDLKGIAGIPNTHVNQPIELIAQVRNWLANRAEADIARLGLYGHSKGAEYAAVAAVRYPWIKAVAACVPSDAVWEGYGIGDERNRPNPAAVRPPLVSSWSWQGEPLPYIALPGDRSAFADNTAYYESRRAADPVAASAATIPVEQASARFLWLGGGRDQVWASGAMAKRNHARLRAAGKGSRSELRVYPTAGHGICGDGSYPTRLWSTPSTDPRVPDPDADARATIDGWRAIKAFFGRVL